MTLEEKKDNTYFDKKGVQILKGDLLKVYHFRTGNKIYYMYQVVVIESGIFDVFALRDYYREKPHYRLFSVADNPQRIYYSAEIIGKQDWETPRKKIKII